VQASAGFSAEIEWEVRMTNRIQSSVVMVSCVVLVVAGSVFAQDWPQWRGPNRDDCVSGFTAPQAWPTEFKQVWKATVGAGCATPALVGDKLYVFTRQGDEEVTQCLNAADGKAQWKDAYAAQAVTPPANRHPGPRSSPAVADGKVVTLGVGGVLSCLDAATGKVLWRKDPFPKVVPQFFTGMSPIIVDGMAIAYLGGAGNGALIAFDLASGDEKWRWGDEGPEYGSPVLLTADGVKQIVTPTEKSLVGVAVADGKLLWQVPSVPARMAYNAATPIMDGQTVIYGGKGRGTKAFKIEKKGDGFVATELWSNADLAPQFNTPVLNDGFLFGQSDRGFLYCIDAKTGTTAWTDATVRGSGGFAAILNAGSCLLALPNDSQLIVYKPNAKQYEEVAKIKVADTPTYAHPVLAGNRLFVKDQDALAMLTIQ
jgi:outer membrane protein assembly factor BamB